MLTNSWTSRTDSNGNSVRWINQVFRAINVQIELFQNISKFGFTNIVAIIFNCDIFQIQSWHHIAIGTAVISHHIWLEEKFGKSMNFSWNHYKIQWNLQSYMPPSWEFESIGFFRFQNHFGCQVLSPHEAWKSWPTWTISKSILFTFGRFQIKIMNNGMYS